MLLNPLEIERTSLKIIDDKIAKSFNGTKSELEIVKRVIHATADFDFAEILKFYDNAILKAHDAIKSHTQIITDTKMISAGINKNAASKFNLQIIQPEDDENIFKQARERNVTRAIINIENAVKNFPNAIYVIGNAPTALIKLCELVKLNLAKPALIIGVPVGFVNVIEAKEILFNLKDTPKIISHGNKGGSTVACAIVNALLYGLSKKFLTATP